MVCNEIFMQEAKHTTCVHLAPTKVKVSVEQVSLGYQNVCVEFQVM
jgi:hypothetical protein